MGILSSLKNAVGLGSNSGSISKTIGSFIPGIGDADAQKDANETNIKLDRMNREWQERMSNSAYQRTMDDMKKAGLNPMLAYQQGGASVPSTSAPSVSAASKTGLASSALSAFTGISAARTAAQSAQTQQAAAESSIKLQDTQTAKTVAETLNTQAETKLKQRELRGKGMKDTLDREGGQIIQNIMDKLKSSAKDSMGRISVIDPKTPMDSETKKRFDYINNATKNIRKQ